jgi:hypothetical protein
MLLLKPCVTPVTPVKVSNAPHKAELSHELIGGAVAYEVGPHLFRLFIDVLIILQAAKAYENHCAKNGKPDSHAKAKEILYVLFCVC